MAAFARQPVSISHRSTPLGGHQHGPAINRAACKQAARRTPASAPVSATSGEQQGSIEACSRHEVPRRNVLTAMLAGAASPVLFAGSGKAEEDMPATIPSTYSDGPDQFSIDIPDGWVAAEGQLDSAKGFVGASGARRALAWFVPGEERKTNVTVVITNIGADFTSLGSFGTAYGFATSLVNSMDQSYLLRAPSWAQPKDKNIQVARLIDADDKNNSYNVEYTVSNNAEGHKHLLSRVLLGYNGVYNRLYTINAQCQEEDWERYAPILKNAVASFKPPKLSVYR